MLRPYRLGAKSPNPIKQAKCLKLEAYAGSRMTEFVPPQFDWFAGVPDSVDLNDELGDCVVAAQAKMVRSWTANASGIAAKITNEDILDVYQKGAGYVPGQPETDEGWDLLSALSYWRRVGIGGHKIAAYASINPRHHNLLKAGTYLFGGLFMSFDLPASIWAQMDAGLLWDVVEFDGGNKGGHCITVQGVDRNGNLKGRTWGKGQGITWPFVDAYCIEAYAVITQDYIVGGKTIAGLDMDRLKADLNLLRG